MEVPADGPARNRVAEGVNHPHDPTRDDRRRGRVVRDGRGRPGHCCESRFPLRAASVADGVLLSGRSAQEPGGLAGPAAIRPSRARAARLLQDGGRVLARRHGRRPRRAAGARSARSAGRPHHAHAPWRAFRIDQLRHQPHWRIKTTTAALCPWSGSGREACSSPPPAAA